MQKYSQRAWIFSLREYKIKNSNDEVRAYFYSNTRHNGIIFFTLSTFLSDVCVSKLMDAQSLTLHRSFISSIYNIHCCQREGWKNAPKANNIKKNSTKLFFFQQNRSLKELYCLCWISKKYEKSNKKRLRTNVLFIGVSLLFLLSYVLRRIYHRVCTKHSLAINILYYSICIYTFILCGRI